LHRCDEEHVRRIAIQLEPLVHAFAQHARRKWPESFAKLDLDVHVRLHARIAWVAEDTAATERARAKLHPAVEPADDRAARENLGDTLWDRRPLELRVNGPGLLEKTLNLQVGVRGSQVCSFHRVARFTVAADDG